MTFRTKCRSRDELQHVAGPRQSQCTSRLLLGLPDDSPLDADFRNRDWRDLRPGNLRATIRGDRAHDEPKSAGLTSAYYNVCAQSRTGKWYCQMRLRDDGTASASLGLFDDEDDAARHVNYIKLRVRGPCGSYNDPTTRRGGLPFAEFNALLEQGADVLPAPGSFLEARARSTLDRLARRYGTDAVDYSAANDDAVLGVA